MNPLSEESLREKITHIVYGDWISYESLATGRVGGVNDNEEPETTEIVDHLLCLSLHDRQAWGEYVIGKNFRKNKNTNGYRRATGDGDWEAAPETWAIAVNAEHKLQRQRNKSFSEQIVESNKEIRKAFQEQRNTSGRSE